MTRHTHRAPRRRAPLLALLAGLLAFCAPLTVCAQQDDPEPTAHPFLWRIEREPACYLYGTIHVPDERVTALPQAVWDAIEACDVLLTEIRLDKPGAMLNKMYLGKGETLAKVLGPELYQRLLDYLERAHAPPAMIRLMDRQKIWAAMMTMLQVEMRDKLSKGLVPLDMMLWKEAGILDLERDALEGIDEQLGVFESFTRDEQIEMLKGTLDLLDELDAEGRDYVEEIIQVYLRGRPDELQEFMEDFSGIGDDDELEQRFEKLLLEDRNVRMVERMVAKMAAAPDKAFFFAVGAAHYAGEQGILKLLADRGVRTERIGAPPAVKPKEKTPVGAGK